MTAPATPTSAASTHEPFVTPARFGRTALSVHVASVGMGAFMMLGGTYLTRNPQEQQTVGSVGFAIAFGGFIWALTILFRARREERQACGTAMGLLIALETGVLGWFAYAERWDKNKNNSHTLYDMLIINGLAWKIPVALVSGIIAIRGAQWLVKKFQPSVNENENAPRIAPENRAPVDKKWTPTALRRIQIALTLGLLSAFYLVLEPPVSTLVSVRLDGLREQKLALLRTSEFLRGARPGASTAC